MTKDEVMQMAIDALENAYDAINTWGGYASTYFQEKHDLEADVSECRKSIEVLRAALAQPEQEPQHKLICPTCKADRTKVDCQGNRMNCGLKFEAHTAQSEPAAWMILATTEPTPIDVTLHAEVVEEIANPIVPLYTAPPQRKPLSDEEIDRAWNGVDYTVEYMQFRIDIARAIEAAHGIKD